MSKGFDFVVKAEKVVIKEKGDNNYKVKLAGVGDFLKYQVWSNTNANNINGDRSVFLLHAKDWVEQFKIVNSNSDVSKSFTPTTVIEIDNKKYVTVITNAEFKNKKVIFHMSTDDVKFNNKKMEKMNKLPKGEFLNVRFDIDDGGGVNSYCADSCSGSGNSIVGVTCNQQCGSAKNCLTNIETAYPGLTTDYTGLLPGVNKFCTEINEMNKISPSEYTTIKTNNIPTQCSIL